jgi:hypothetical protein
VELPLRRFFDEPTVAGLATAIGAQCNGADARAPRTEATIAVTPTTINRTTQDAAAALETGSPLLSK